MTKYRNLDHLDVLPASWTDAIQEDLAGVASRLLVTRPAANQLKFDAGSGDDQFSIAVKGLYRWITTSITITHPAGNAGVVHNIWAVASANVFSAPDNDTTDYSFGIQILPNPTTPTGNHNGKAITVYRKIGETDWDGTSILGLRMIHGQTGNIHNVFAKAPGATIPAIVAQGISGQSAEIFRVEDSAGAVFLSIGAMGGLASRRVADADVAYATHKIGEANDRLQITTLGSLGWSSGAAVPDTNLYRSAADTLKTDDSLVVGSNLRVMGSGAAAVAIDLDQGLAVVNQAVNTSISYATNIADGATPYPFAILADGKMEWGAGAATRDTNLYRSAADTLKTDDSLVVGAALTVAGNLAHNGSNVGFYGRTPTAINGTPFMNGAAVGTTQFDLPTAFTMNQLAALVMTLIKQLGDVNGVGLVNTTGV